MKTSELTGVALDWAVAQCEGEDYSPITTYSGLGAEFPPTNYSTNWAQGGPIIERERMWFKHGPSTGWEAIHGLFLFPNCITGMGPTMLVAAMRCYVASKLGDEVDVPEELT